MLLGLTLDIGKAYRFDVHPVVTSLFANLNIARKSDLRLLSIVNSSEPLSSLARCGSIDANDLRHERGYFVRGRQISRWAKRELRGFNLT
ncbi:hypothetical protein EVAR_63874_1 [Eumeta japonica]|uniref:Uncharacterized protein n=1 Tax=Eumeta variegata TaxID=151549 RepID=A0A4C1ZYX5_EUMVA|nr:hypothetical protein EVAR_63874_1 [Eumeta japonica]